MWDYSMRECAERKKKNSGLGVSDLETFRSSRSTGREGTQDNWSQQTSGTIAAWRSRLTGSRGTKCGSRVSSSGPMEWGHSGLEVFCRSSDVIEGRRSDHAACVNKQPV